jgi:hypothetical protein
VEHDCDFVCFRHVFFIKTGTGLIMNNNAIDTVNSMYWVSLCSTSNVFTRRIKVTHFDIFDFHQIVVWVWYQNFKTLICNYIILRNLVFGTYFTQMPGTSKSSVTSATLYNQHETVSRETRFFSTRSLICPVFDLYVKKVLCNAKNYS